MLRTLLLTYSFFYVFNSVLLAQETGTVLIISDFSAHLMIDGEDKGAIDANKPQKFELQKGEHYIQLFHSSLGTEKSSIIEIESGKQIVHKVELLINPEMLKDHSQIVVDGQLSIPGLMDENAAQGTTVYYGFEKGDEITLDFDLVNNNGKCAISIFTYPNNNIKYSNSDFQNLKQIKIKVVERGIYGFTFTTFSLLNRTGQIKIKRKAESEATKEFNTEVVLEQVFTPVPIQENINFVVDPGFTASINGKSRVILPITLPENTVKWFYKFAAFRNNEDLDKVKGTMNLLGELTKLIDNTGTLAFGIDLLSSPPGTDKADVFLLDADNFQKFRNKQDEIANYFAQGTMENLNSGNVEIDCCTSGNWYLGLRNPSTFYEINIAIEVVAITSHYELRMKN